VIVCFLLGLENAPVEMQLAVELEASLAEQSLLRAGREDFLGQPLEFIVVDVVAHVVAKPYVLYAGIFNHFCAFDCGQEE